MLYESINVPLWNELRHVQNMRILDVGCGTAALGELLSENGNYVEGITHSQSEAEISKKRIDKVHVLNLDKLDSMEFAIDGRFDIILFADVLEHLLAPEATLGFFAQFLSENGKVYVSLPNVACFYVRLGLLFGRFDMSSAGGILDETHLHFYTRKSARLLLRKSGFEIIRARYVPAMSVWAYQFIKKPQASTPQKMADSGLFKFYERWVYPVESLVARCWPGLLANQFVFTISPTKPVSATGTELESTTVSNLESAQPARLMS